MKNSQYASGETPIVGDIVEVSKNNTFSYTCTLYDDFGLYGNSYRWRGHKFKVVDINQGPRSTLVLIESATPDSSFTTTNYMKASNFVLMSRAKDEPEIQEPSKDPQDLPYALIETDQGYTSVSSLKELDERVRYLLKSNPLGKYRFFVYRGTASAQEPKIQIKYEGVTVKEDTSSLKDTASRPRPDDIFK